jgi:hypothetical protein
MPGQVKERIHFGYRNPLRPIGNFHDLVARANDTFLQNAKVEAWPVMRYKQGGHARFVHTNADAIAGDAWLRHFEESLANAIAISYAHFIVGQSVDREVFAEVSVDKVLAVKLGLPVAIRVELVNHDGADFAAVSCEVALAVPFNIETPDHSPIGDGELPYGCVNGFATPLHIAR